MAVRGLLGIANAGALAAYGRGVRAAHGRLAGMWWVIFVAGQFHVLFYASRTLPNTFAFPLSMFPCASLKNGGDEVDATKLHLPSACCSRTEARHVGQFVHRLP